MIALVQYAGLSERGSPWVNATVAGEAFGNLRQRNQFATLTNIGLLSLLYLLPRRQDAERGVWETLGGLAAATLLSLGNAASSSRTGAAQLAVIVVMALVWKNQRQRAHAQALVAAVTGYIAGALLLPWLTGLDPFNSSILGRLHHSVPDCNSRLVLWSNVLHLIALRPLAGLGLG